MNKMEEGSQEDEMEEKVDAEEEEVFREDRENRKSQLKPLDSVTEFSLKS